MIFHKAESAYVDSALFVKQLISKKLIDFKLKTYKI